MEENYIEVWNDIYKTLDTTNVPKYDDWLDEFQGIINSSLLDAIDLGCGIMGNNSRYLIERGKGVVSCDFVESVVKSVEKFNPGKTKLFDMLDGLPFEDNSADIIIADLCIHYFTKDDTIRIINEIRRVLRSNGHLFFRVNSTGSTEFKKLIDAGVEEIEHHLFFTKKMKKRFFSKSDLDELFADWTFISQKEENMDRYNTDKIVWKCAVKNNKNDI